MGGRECAGCQRAGRKRACLAPPGRALLSRAGALIIRAMGRLGDGLRGAAAACAAADRWLAAQLSEAAPANDGRR